jgi:hypothetical protein
MPKTYLLNTIHPRTKARKIFHLSSMFGRFAELFTVRQHRGFRISPHRPRPALLLEVVQIFFVFEPVFIRLLLILRALAALLPAGFCNNRFLVPFPGFQLILLLFAIFNFLIFLPPDLSFGPSFGRSRHAVGCTFLQIIGVVQFGMVHFMNPVCI